MVLPSLKFLSLFPRFLSLTSSVGGTPATSKSLLPFTCSSNAARLDVPKWRGADGFSVAGRRQEIAAMNTSASVGRGHARDDVVF